MVVREDGSKWACQSCLKGHRVSGCTHTDRELTLVPKKGRPVTQCHHCRLERKKRSAHVRCDCGEAEKPHHPKEKCIHLREAEERAKNGLREDHAIERDPHHLAAVAEEQGCCCHHGGKCSCAMVKREDGHEPLLGPAVQKPRLESTRSDGSLTVFANGHHKPVHRKNYAAHEAGMPYKMPMARAHTDQHVSAAARRSVDSLVLDSNAVRTLSAFSNSVSSFFPPEQRPSRSEQASPRLAALRTSNGDPMDDPLASLEFPEAAMTLARSSVGSIPSEMLSFPPLDPMSAATDNGFDPWSNFPSADSTLPNNNPFGAWPTLPDGGAFGQPALTAASSGTQSEIDEIPPMEDFYGFMPSIQEDDAQINSDGGAANANGAANRHSLPPGFFGNTNFSMPVTGEEWQASVAAPTEMNKNKPMVGDGPYNTNDMWSMTSPTFLPPGRPNNGNTIMTRPQSHSIGPGSAPGEDIIKQLFPEDADIQSSASRDFSSVMTDTSAPWKRYFSGSDAHATSTAMDFTTGFEDESGMMPATWSDNSINVPADAFASPFNLDQEFSTPDYSGQWPQ